MARPKHIHGIDANQPFYASAAAVFEVRIRELWDWARHLPHADRVQELHDMRIAAKRLRYGIEFYEPCFNSDMTGLLEQFRQLQDLLGDVHDYDVWQVMLRRRLASGETLDQLLDDLSDVRDARYRELVAFWERLEQEDFRSQLEAAVADVGPGTGQ